MDIETFRADFPEFSDTTAYPDDGVTYWLNLGSLLLNPTRWCALLPTGLELFIAHNLALERNAQISAGKGQVPGLATGATASKAVDKVSVSYDTTVGLEPNAGHWALTTFGSRLLRLARMVGAGGVQL